MNAHSLAHTAYAATRQAALRTPRATEYDALAKITARLQQAAACPASFPALVAALHDNRRLWTIFAADVADDANGLPKQVRAQIFYLSQFVTAHTSQVLAHKAEIEPLIETNIAIMRGLSREGRSE